MSGRALRHHPPPTRSGGGPRTRQGQGTVELALALPVVAVALLLVVQAGLVIADHVVAVHAAREAARAVAVDGRAGVAERAAVEAGGDGCRATVTRPAAVGAVLRVTLRCPAPTEVALVGPLLPDVTVVTSAAMRVER